MIFSPKQNQFVYIVATIEVAVITAAITTTHHEITLRYRLKLRYLVICAVVSAAVITAAFL